MKNLPKVYKVPFDKRLAREIEFRGREGTVEQTSSYVAPEALRRMIRSERSTLPRVGFEPTTC